MKIIKSLPLVILTYTIALFSFGQPANKGVIIVIQPFGDIPPYYVSDFKKKASEIIPSIIIKATIPLPPIAYCAIRNRYRADSLLDILTRSTPNGQVTIGLTTKDISCTDARSSDWGVFGLSNCAGKACVVSTFRIKRR